jgi:hypothetical protein|tara:strand:- start:135 stop:470 length:336 start_codon:yes stop_codon:yes gene_type:complete
MTETVDFGRSQVTDTTTGEAETTIYVGKREVGYIEKGVDDVGATSHEWVTSHYTVTLWEEDEVTEKDFHVAYRARSWGGSSTRMTKGHETARKALAAAKKWARETLGSEEV